MTLSTTELGEHRYDIGKLDAFTQLHLLRKLAPVLAKLEGVDKLTGGEEGFLKVLAPLSEAIAEMSEEDVNYICQKALSVVSRVLPKSTIPVWNKQAKRLQFEDLTLPEMLTLVGAVLEANLSGFLGGLGRATSAPPPQ